MSLFDLSEYGSISLSSDTDQRYTPDYYLSKVDFVLLGIGLDPTADPGKRVSALHHITEAEDCFTTDWAPMLSIMPTSFMNPPYSNTAPFLGRWCDYVRSGAIERGVTLTLAGVLCNKGTQQLVARYARAVCFPFGRINFINGGTSNDRDTVFVLWGNGCTEDTIERFSVLGGLLVEVHHG